jgi:hypothetical protein
VTKPGHVPLEALGVKLLVHPPRSPDLTPHDFSLSPDQKTVVAPNGQCFEKYK